MSLSLFIVRMMCSAGHVQAAAAGEAETIAEAEAKLIPRFHSDYARLVKSGTLKPGCTCGIGEDGMRVELCLTNCKTMAEVHELLSEEAESKLAGPITASVAEAAAEFSRAMEGARAALVEMIKQASRRAAAQQSAKNN